MGDTGEATTAVLLPVKTLLGCETGGIQAEVGSKKWSQ